MENGKSKFVNAVMLICPIVIWACLFAVMFIENTTAHWISISGTLFSNWCLFNT